RALAVGVSSHDFLRSSGCKGLAHQGRVTNRLPTLRRGFRLEVRVVLRAREVCGSAVLVDLPVETFPDVHSRSDSCHRSDRALDVGSAVGTEDSVDLVAVLGIDLSERLGAGLSETSGVLEQLASVAP